MCPDQGSNLQPFGVQDDATTNTRPGLAYLFQLSVNTAKAIKEVNDLRVELKLLFWVLWVAAGKQGTDDREEEETANV